MEIKLSLPLPKLQSGHCVFHFKEDIGNKRFTLRLLGNRSAIHRVNDFDTFTCRVPDLTLVMNRIKGMVKYNVVPEPQVLYSIR